MCSGQARGEKAFQAEALRYKRKWPEKQTVQRRERGGEKSLGREVVPAERLPTVSPPGPRRPRKKPK
jgi:hypothetical protein